MAHTIFYGEMVKSTTIGEHPVFARDGGASASTMLSADVQDAILALRLTADESLHVRSGIFVYVRPRSDRGLTDLLMVLVRLANALPVDSERRPSFSELPDQFCSLVPMIRKWAMSDDADRTERIERASRQELQALVRRVSPQFAAINAYLDGFADGLPDSACTLGRLAEAAAEAKLMLDAPTGSSLRANSGPEE